MTRTVKSHKFTYAVNEMHENGEITTQAKTVTVCEYNEQKALKMACKKVGFQIIPLKTEVIEEKYFIEDEVFFKYAKKIVEE